INFITIFQNANEINIIENYIINKGLWNFKDADLGQRFNQIQKAIPKFLDLIQTRQTTFFI
ncbi:hypothetical protein, partial [Snodgrassella alvi]|uniref:hypothetical protein n=1 Tax=Snodgrassella alvi TaxID=1196083 RepID=UPI001C558792